MGLSDLTSESGVANCSFFKKKIQFGVYQSVHAGKIHRSKTSDGKSAARPSDRQLLTASTRGGCDLSRGSSFGKSSCILRLSSSRCDGSEHPSSPAAPIEQAGTRQASKQATRIGRIPSLPGRLIMGLNPASRVLRSSLYSRSFSDQS